MGQMADDVMVGFMCSWCGTCFEQEHGYPVLCDSCFEDSTEKERDGLQRPINKEI